MHILYNCLGKFLSCASMPCILYMTDYMITDWANNSINDMLLARKCTFLQSLLLCMGMRHWGQLFSLQTSKSALPTRTDSGASDCS